MVTVTVRGKDLSYKFVLEARCPQALISGLECRLLGAKISVRVGRSESSGFRI